MKATFEITPELAAGLKELRASQGTSASAAVRLALTAYLKTRGIELKPVERPKPSRKAKQRMKGGHE